MKKSGKIRIVLADDHVILRQGVASLLQYHPRIQIVGEADNGKEALDLLKKNDTDVLVMDLEMPVMSGLEAFTVARNRFPHVKVIIFSMYFNDLLITDFMAKGAAAYLGKDRPIKDLEAAICAAADRGYYFDEESSLAMCNGLKGKSSSMNFSKASLTERELEILKLICDDKTNKEISKCLNIEPRTVEFHRQNIYKKTNCRKPAGLALYAVKHGIISAKA